MYSVNLKCCERVFHKDTFDYAGMIAGNTGDLKEGEPLAVDKFGNDTMINFGYALLKKRPAFTFPKAKNIKEDRTVVVNNKQNSNQQ
jgi:hypothetical protein